MTYHTVAPHDVPAFERQMAYLGRSTHPVFADAEPAMNGRVSVAVTFDDAFDSLFDGALPAMARQGVPATIFVPTGYMGREAGWRSERGTANRPSGRVASAERLRQADPGLVRLGSHTVTHPRLADLECRDIAREVQQSRQQLESFVGAPVTMLALPYGSCSGDVVRISKASGYTRVFANVPVPAQAPADGLFGRIDVSPRDWPLEFRLKAAGAYQWLVWAIPLKRALLAPLRGVWKR
jgi:peptidoglycan/xylan/chitin deacetylase (PgdA/CDA1 family)